MTSIQTTQNTITIQPLFKWDSEESYKINCGLTPVLVASLYPFAVY